MWTLHDRDPYLNLPSIVLNVVVNTDLGVQTNYFTFLDADLGITWLWIFTAVCQRF